MDINDISEYKLVKKRAFEAYICKPQIGATYIDNVSGAECKTTYEKPLVIQTPGGHRYSESICKADHDFVRYDKEHVAKYIARNMDENGNIDWFRVTSIVYCSDRGVYIMDTGVKPMTVRDSLTGRSITVNIDPNRKLGQHIVCENIGNKPDLMNKRVVDTVELLGMYGKNTFKKSEIKLFRPNYSIVKGEVIRYEDSIASVDLHRTSDEINETVRRYIGGFRAGDGSTISNIGKVRYTIKVKTVKGVRVVEIKRYDRYINKEMSTLYFKARTKLLVDIFRVIFGEDSVIKDIS